MEPESSVGGPRKASGRPVNASASLISYNPPDIPPGLILGLDAVFLPGAPCASGFQRMELKVMLSQQSSWAIKTESGLVSQIGAEGSREAMIPVLETLG